jgi:hypothetical protein
LYFTDEIIAEINKDLKKAVVLDTLRVYVEGNSKQAADPVLSGTFKWGKDDEGEYISAPIPENLG